MSGVGNSHGFNNANFGLFSVSEFYDQSSLGSIKLESASPSPSPSNNPMMDALSNNPILTTASVPIPSRNQSQRNMMADLSEYVFDIEQSQSPQILQDLSFITSTANSNLHASTPVDTILTLQNISTESGFSSDGIPIGTINVTGFGPTELWSTDAFGQIVSPASTVSSATNVGGQQGQFHMDEDDIYQLDKDELISDPTLGDIFSTDLLHEDMMLLNPPMSQPSPNLSGDSGSGSAIHLSPSLPQQILRGNTTQNAGNIMVMNVSNNMQLTSDLLLSTTSEIYDDRTHNSTSPYASNTANSPAAFSPGSHSSSPSLGFTQTQTPPPQNRLHQQIQLNAFNNNNHMVKMENTEKVNTQQNVTNNNIGRNPNNVGQVQYNPKYSTLQQLLMSNNSERSGMLLGQSVPGSSASVLMSGTALSPGGFSGRRLIHHLQTQAGSSHSGIGGAGSGGGTSGGTMSRLSSSAPTHIGMDLMWQRREPRPHLLSTGSLAEAGSTSSLSTGSILSPEAPDFSHDEGFSDDSDHYEDCSTGDEDSDIEDNAKAAGGGPSGSSKAKRYFWQYNVQAKGPKGQRLVIKTQTEDPHVLNEITDPVFSPHCSVRGIKNLRLQHSGKARKGDGNDLTPNPKKLHNIGKELDKLGRVINDMTPVSELPFNARPKTRKEKNKLASRACRLKKKAQHEANKIKLYGLETEHKRLINGIHQIKQILVTKCSQGSTESSEEYSQKLDSIVKASSKLKIAGNSTEFVNKILETIRSGHSVNIDKVLEEF